MNLPPQRRSIRYEGYDYCLAGYYALTICARDKAPVFGALQPGEPLAPSLLGQAVLTELAALPTHYPTVRLDTWVLMPNHLHLLVALTRHHAVAVSELGGSLKSRCYRRWHQALLTAGQPAPLSCWQRNYYERIVRNAAELESQRQYILANPDRWNK